MRAIVSTKIEMHAASITNAVGTLKATTAPPIAGPITDAIWKQLLFQVAALLNNSAGTIWGSSAALAGRPKVAAIPPRSRRTYIEKSEPSE